MENISCEMEKLVKKVNGSQQPSSNDNIKLLQQIIIDGISSIKQTITAQQTNSISEKRIIIFPEFRSSECYRLLFNCIIYLTIATYGFLIIKVVVDHQCRQRIILICEKLYINYNQASVLRTIEQYFDYGHIIYPLSCYRNWIFYNLNYRFHFFPS